MAAELLLHSSVVQLPSPPPSPQYVAAPSKYRKNHLATLPWEVLGIIVHFLATSQTEGLVPTSLLELTVTCRWLRAFVDCEQTWRAAYLSRFDPPSGPLVEGYKALLRRRCGVLTGVSRYLGDESGALQYREIYSMIMEHRSKNVRQLMKLNTGVALVRDLDRHIRQQLEVQPYLLLTMSSLSNYDFSISHIYYNSYFHDCATYIEAQFSCTKLKSSRSAYLSGPVPESMLAAIHLYLVMENGGQEEYFELMSRAHELGLEGFERGPLARRIVGDMEAPHLPVAEPANLAGRWSGIYSMERAGPTFRLKGPTSMRLELSAPACATDARARFAGLSSDGGKRLEVEGWALPLADGVRVKFWKLHPGASGGRFLHYGYLRPEGIVGHWIDEIGMDSGTFWLWRTSRRGLRGAEGRARAGGPVTGPGHPIARDADCQKGPKRKGPNRLTRPCSTRLAVVLAPRTFWFTKSRAIPARDHTTDRSSRAIARVSLRNGSDTK
ncbi:uncharacterized protein VTP21DRAFT_8463 [Calcarisporiella thermophila]|uniref:uncharacterized protein n=1 Tax=Calcarisporiella thermophila TaxID=911321 RepID=UPI0037441B2B